MRIIRAVDYRRMPWKNGGGSTTEIAIAPANATLDDFDWRISMAHVATSGPFSQFLGIDRTLAIIQGHGLLLKINDAPPVTLKRSAPPHFFPGDVATTATLVDGPIDDLNVMSRRACYRHRMEHCCVEEAIAMRRDADVNVVMPRGGNVAIVMDKSATSVADGETAILDYADIPAKGLEIRKASSGRVDVFVIQLNRVQNER